MVPSMNARLSIFAAFLFSGTLAGNWFARIPSIQIQFSLSDAALGFVLMGFAIGVVIGLLLVGGLIQRWGSRLIIQVTTLIGTLSFVLAGISPSVMLLTMSIFVVGVMLSALDVAMNEQAVQLEIIQDRSLMSAFHAAFSFGMLLGALMGYGYVSYNLSVAMHFVTAGPVLAILAMTCYRCLIEPNAYQNALSEPKAPTIMIPPRAVWGLGAIAFGASISEGALADWVGVYLRTVHETTEQTATIGFVVFALVMALARLFGDRMVNLMGAQKPVRYGGMMAVIGLLIIVSSVSVPMMLVGVAIVSFGIANIMPIVFSAAGRQPGVSASVGIAAVSSIGYSGFLAGPPVIGLVAHETSLAVSFSLLILILLPTIMLAYKVKRSPAS